LDYQTIDAINRLVQTIGVGHSCLMAAGAAIALAGIHIWRSRKADAAHREVIDAKNETIERIAEQNREARFEIYVLRGMNTQDAHLMVYGRPLGQPALPSEGHIKALPSGKGRGKP